MLKKSLSILPTMIIASLFCQPTVAKTKTDTLPEQCLQMFKMTEQLISEAAKQPGTHMQVAELKKKLKATKEEIAELDHEMQQKSCEKGLANLNTLKQKH